MQYLCCNTSHLHWGLNCAQFGQELKPHSPGISFTTPPLVIWNNYRGRQWFLSRANHPCLFYFRWVMFQNTGQITCYVWRKLKLTLGESICLWLADLLTSDMKLFGVDNVLLNVTYSSLQYGHNRKHLTERHCRSTLRYKPETEGKICARPANNTIIILI